MQGLGEAHVRTGKSEDGAAYLREALGIFRLLGMPAAEHVTRRLAEIGTLLAALTGHSQPPSFGLLIFNFETRTLSYARSVARRRAIARLLAVVSTCANNSLTLA